MNDPQNLNWTLINEMAAALTPEQRDQAEWRIRNTGKLPMGDFEIAIGFLFGLASLAFFGRITIRIWTRRRILLDDSMLCVGFACLVASTAIFYKRARIIYLVFALMGGDQIASLIASQEISDIYGQMDWSFSYITFLWTTVFMVKLCYLAFFHTLLLSMSRALTRYYWTAVVVTLIAWIYLVLQQLITCPYFGSSSSKCFPTLPISDALLNFTFWTGPVLDALTDALIVSIPILILRKSQMAMLTKIGIGVFLCLSLFMLACSITRAAGTYYNGTLDTPWQVFWLHAEACVAVLMASITVYRSVLIGSSDASTRFQRYLENIIKIRTSEGLSEAEQLTLRDRFAQFLLSKIPNATLTGLATMFAELNNTHATATDLSKVSDFEMGDTDYHMHLKKWNSVESPGSTNKTLHSPAASQEPWRAPATWTSTSTEAQTGEQCRSPGRVTAFFLRFLLPQSHGVMLKHRSMAAGNVERDTQ